MTQNRTPADKKATISKDLIDQLRTEWRKENPSLDTSGMEVAGRIMIAAQQLQTRLARMLKPFDLNYSDFDVLATLRRSGPPYSLAPTELMRSVVLTSGAVTALLGRLEKRGLIAREDDSSDGRVRKATLTQKGQELVDQIVTDRFAEASDAVKGLTKAERKELTVTLKRLNAWLKEIEQDN